LLTTTPAPTYDRTDRTGHDPIDQDFDVLPGDRQAVAHVEQWFEELARTGDPDIRERIIHAYLGLAERLAERYRHSAEIPLEDLRQTARLGLVKAVDRYDPGRANPFVPYAVVTVRGELKRCLRDSSWRLRIPRGTKELALRVGKALDELPQQLGRHPTVADLADHLGLDATEVQQALSAHRSRSAVSLDHPVGTEGGTNLGELLADEPSRTEVEDLLSLPVLLGRLPEREARIVRLRFDEELTQDQIAARVGISQMHVSRLLRRALDRMRTQLVDVA
jgi:RNA polymerase sigma-B factor